MEELMTSLLDLHHELGRRGIPILVGGGFGLYLKRRHLERFTFSRSHGPRGNAVPAAPRRLGS
jgi:hypothetical protein